MIILIATIILKLMGLIVCTWQTIAILATIWFVHKHLPLMFKNKFQIKDYNYIFTKD